MIKFWLNTSRMYSINFCIIEYSDLLYILTQQHILGCDGLIIIIQFPESKSIIR